MTQQQLAVAPSGQQYEISRQDQAVTVVEVGGALRAYTVDGRDVLDGYRVDEMCTGARGQPLMPWPNRLEDGAYRFAGKDYQVPLSEPAARNAIHGFVRFANWTLSEHADDRVTLGHVLHPQPGYPFTLDVRNEYLLADGGLTVAMTATNLGVESLPFGYGAHPYVTVGTPSIDTAVLELDAATWLPTTERGLPTGRAPVAGTEHDFRTGRPIGQTKIDHAYTDLVRDKDGRARLRLSGPDGGRRVELWLDENFPYVELFTGDALPEQARRRRGLGVEPMSCAPNAFRSGEGLRILAPGDTVTMTWGIIPG